MNSVVFVRQSYIIKAYTGKRRFLLSPKDNLQLLARDNQAFLENSPEFSTSISVQIYKLKDIGKTTVSVRPQSKTRPEGTPRVNRANR